MGKSRSRKPRNSATFRLCPRPGAADASDRVLVRVDGNPYYLPGFAEGEDEGYDGAFPSSSAYEDQHSHSSSSIGTDGLPEHVRREILELGLPDDGYNYLTHIREFRPSFSSTGGGGSSAAFIPNRRTPRRGPALSVKAYDARSVEVGTDNVAAAAVVTTIEEAVDPDVTKLLEEDGDLPQGTSEDEESEEDEGLEEGGEFDEDEELEEDFVIIANQPEEEDLLDLEDEWCILDGEEEQMRTKEMLSL